MCAGAADCSVPGALVLWHVASTGLQTPLSPTAEGCDVAPRFRESVHAAHVPQQRLRDIRRHHARPPANVRSSFLAVMSRSMLTYALCVCQLAMAAAFLSSPKIAPSVLVSPSSSHSPLQRLQPPHAAFQRQSGRTAVAPLAPLAPRHRMQQQDRTGGCEATPELTVPRAQALEKNTSSSFRSRPSRRSLATPRFAALAASALAAGLAVAVLAPGPAAAAAKAIVAGSEDEVHLHLGQKVANFFRQGGLPDWATLMTISAMPVVELRGGVPVGIWMGMPIAKVFGLCVAGNMIPIPIILLALRSSFVQKLAKPVLDRARERAAKFGDEKSQALALTLFVGIPLPGTGAWTGAMGAFLLGMPFQKVSRKRAGALLAWRCWLLRKWKTMEALVCGCSAYMCM